MRILFLSIVLIAAAFSVLFVRGSGSGPGASSVASERTKAIARTCAACHGTDGRIQTDIPAIAGRPEAVLSAQLLAFKQDEIPGATVMPRLTRGFTDEELKAVAGYFAGLDVRSPADEEENP